MRAVVPSPLRALLAEWMEHRGLSTVTLTVRLRWRELQVTGLRPLGADHVVLYTGADEAYIVDWESIDELKIERAREEPDRPPVGFRLRGLLADES